MPVSISVSDAYDGGNGKLVKIQENESTGVTEVWVNIRPDVYTELEDIQHMQYFSFRACISGAVEAPLRIKYIVANAQDASYPEAWSGTTVCYTENVRDAESWKRNIDTYYTQGQLSWEHIHTCSGSLFFSYFAPYSYERHLSLVAKCGRKSNSAVVQSLGQTLEGREIECITTGTGSLTAWIIHRQHPGETMAEFYAEGLLTRLLGLETADSGGQRVDDTEDEIVKEILGLYTFHIVPCMCPDGAVRGHLRTNSVGANLNREWHPKGDYAAPTLTRSPEVHCVLNRMMETGVDVFLDIHGDEELPFNFIAGAHHVPNWGPRLEALHGAFVAAYARANSDMQEKIGYPPPESPETVLQYMNVATNQVCHRFDCLAITLEMPFKDCRSNPDPAYGWSPARSRKLGASVLEPLMYVHKYLRAEGEFWKELPPQDAHVTTTDEYEEEEKDGFKPLHLHKRFYSDVHEGHPHYSDALKNKGPIVR